MSLAFRKLPPRVPYRPRWHRPASFTVGAAMPNDYVDLFFAPTAILAVCNPDAEGCRSAIQPACRDAIPAAWCAAHAPALSHGEPLASVWSLHFYGVLFRA